MYLLFYSKLFFTNIYKDHEVKYFISTLKEFIKNGEFENLLLYVENTLDHILESYPKILFWIYKCWFLFLKKHKQTWKAEEIYNKFLFLSYRKSEKFKNKIITFSVILHSLNPEISKKIDKYTEKLVSLIEKILLESNIGSCMQKIEINKVNFQEKQYCENRHIAILSKMEINEDDSSLSDLEDEILKTCQVSHMDNIENIKSNFSIKNTGNNIFEIKKDRKMTVSSVSSSSTNHTTGQNNLIFEISKNKLNKFNKIDEDSSCLLSTKLPMAQSSPSTIRSLPEVFNSLQQFTKFVDYVQDSKEFQPLMCLSKEIGMDTCCDSRKTSNNFMDGDTEMGYDNLNEMNEIDIEMNENQPDSETLKLVNQVSFNNSHSNSYGNSQLNSKSQFPTYNSFKVPKNYKIDPVNEPYSNFNFYNKPYIPKIKSKEKLMNLVPFLKDFKPKFLKKENIDKKILRKFRNYVKIIYKIEKDVFDNYDKHFWKDFTTINLLPPMKYENEYKIKVEFKSFNTKYLLWLFSKEGCAKMYQDFTSKFSEQILQDFINSYDLITIDNTSEEGIIEKLKYYIKAVPEIYAKRGYLIETSTDNYTQSNLSYGNGTLGTIHSEELLASYLGADFNFGGVNAFNLKIFGVEHTVYPRCATESHRNYYEDYESYCHLSDESFDSIPSVE